MGNPFIIAVVDDNESNLNTFANVIRSKFQHLYLDVKTIPANVGTAYGRKLLAELLKAPLCDLYIIDVSLTGIDNVSGLEVFAELWGRSIREDHPIWVIIYSEQTGPISMLGPAFGGRHDLPLHFEQKTSTFDIATHLFNELEAVWKFHSLAGLSLAHYAAELAEIEAMNESDLLGWLGERTVFIPCKGEMSLACYFPDLATSLVNRTKRSDVVRTELLQRMSSGSLWMWYQKFFLNVLPEWNGKSIGYKLTHPGHTVAAEDYEAALKSAMVVDRSLFKELSCFVKDVARLSGNDIVLPNDCATTQKCNDFKDNWRVELIKELLHRQGAALRPIQSAAIYYSDAAQQAVNVSTQESGLRAKLLPHRLYCNTESVRNGLSVLGTWMAQSGCTQICVDLAVTPLLGTDTNWVQVSYTDNGRGIEHPDIALHATAGRGGQAKELSRLRGYCSLIVETVNTSGYVLHDFWTGKTRDDTGKKNKPTYTKFTLDFVLPFTLPSSLEVRDE